MEAGDQWPGTGFRARGKTAARAKNAYINRFSMANFG